MIDDRAWYDQFNIYYSEKLPPMYGKEFLYPFNPIYAGFKITEKCNQNCEHCWSGRYEGEFSLLQIKMALDKLKSFDIYHLTITGGEPFLREDCLEIIKHAKMNFPVVEIFSNAQLLTDEIIEELSRILTEEDFIQISLDGLRDSYKIQRGVDAYDIVTSNISKLVNAGINVRIHMTVTKYNDHEILEVYKKCVELKCNTFSVTFVYPLRKGNEIRHQSSLNKYEEEINNLILYHKKESNSLILRTFMPLEIRGRYAKIQTNDDSIFFNNNILHWTIDAEGNIFNFLDHCYESELRIGNIFSDGILEIERGNLAVQNKILFRDLSKVKCSRCNLLHDCRGGDYIENYPNINLPDSRCRANV